MKFSIFLLTSTLASASASSASRPTLSFQVRDGKFDTLAGLDPTLTWLGSTVVKDTALSLTASIPALSLIPTSTAQLSTYVPKTNSITARASKQIKSWGLSSQLLVKNDDYKNVNLKLLAANKDFDLSMKVTATPSSPTYLTVLELSKSFTVPSNGRVTVNPRYNVPTNSGDVTLAYDIKGTSVEVTGDGNEQTIRVGQGLDDVTRVTPSYSIQSKKVSLEIDRSLGNNNAVRAVIKPNESLKVEWKDQEWTADVTCPLEGFYGVKGGSVRVRREISF